jgi:ethanolamine ammonia-lyase small subunit
MPGNSDLFLPRDLSDGLRKIRERTPARIFEGRAGAAYRTSAQLDLREAHAAARDAVSAEFHLASVFDDAFISQWNLREVSTAARNKKEYLVRPDLGRQFSEEAQQEISRRCSRGCDIQILIGDGLSVTAVSAQVPALLPLVCDGARERKWSVGQIFAVRYCRVGILNEIGELLAPKVAILLIGERPGLATAESLSAYMAFRPDKTHTDANRNLISNIHARGISPEAAARRIVNLAAAMMAQELSGVGLQQALPGTGFSEGAAEGLSDHSGGINKT